MVTKIRSYHEDKVLFSSVTFCRSSKMDQISPEENKNKLGYLIEDILYGCDLAVVRVILPETFRLVLIRIMEIALFTNHI